MVIALAVTALICVVINIVLSIVIVAELQKRKVKINYFLIRLLIPKYVHQYRKLLEADGENAGGLFYGWLFTINAALLFGVAALILRAT